MNMLNIIILNEKDLKKGIDINGNISFNSFEHGVISDYDYKKCELLLLMSKNGIVHIVISRFPINCGKYNYLK